MGKSSKPKAKKLQDEGPGYYEREGAFGAQASSTRSSTPAVSFGGGVTRTKSKVKLDEVPGPETGVMHSSFGNQASGKCYSGSSFSFGGVKRDDDKNKEPWSERNPSPKYYDSPSSFGEHPTRASNASYSLTSRRWMPNETTPARSDSPGPGQYNKTEPGEAYSEMTRFGKKSIARESEDWAANVGRLTSSSREIDMAHRY